MSEEMLIYGKNSVTEALESGTREFNKILIADNTGHDEKIELLKKMAKENGVLYQFVKREKLDKLAEGNRHQGVIALVSPVKYCDLDEFLSKTTDGFHSAVLLDGIEDSHNLGAIIRSAVCAGVKAIIIPSRRGVLINSTVEKTSAGAVNHISVIKVNSTVSALQKLKEHNWWVIAADHNSVDNHYDIDYNGMNFVLVMGAEHSGISKSVMKLADFRVKIPMLTNFNSLNVSNAAAIILFESVRQKLNKK